MHPPLEGHNSFCIPPPVASGKRGWPKLGDSFSRPHLPRGGPLFDAKQKNLLPVFEGHPQFRLSSHLTECTISSSYSWGELWAPMKVMVAQAFLQEHSHNHGKRSTAFTLQATEWKLIFLKAQNKFGVRVRVGIYFIFSSSLPLLQNDTTVCVLSMSAFKQRPHEL